MNELRLTFDSWEDWQLYGRLLFDVEFGSEYRRPFITLYEPDDLLPLEAWYGHD